jgi:hypothetical protein
MKLSSGKNANFKQNSAKVLGGKAKRTVQRGKK